MCVYVYNTFLMSVKSVGKEINYSKNISHLVSQLRIRTK